MQVPQRSRPWTAWLLPVLALVVAVFGAIAVWLAVHALLRGHDLRWCAWFAPVVAVDIALMLRLAAAPPGRARALLATLGTAVAVGAGLWTLAAAQVAWAMGLSVLESVARMGPVLAGALLHNGLTGLDWFWLLAALPLAWRLGR